MKKIVGTIINKSEAWFDSFYNLNVIIGRANQGPALAPLFVSNISQASNVATVFGRESELYNAAWEAYNGVGNYCFIKINGRHKEIFFDNIFTVTSIGCEHIYNGYSVNIVSINDEKFFCVYNSDLSICCRYALEGLSLGGLAAKLNADAQLNICPFYGEAQYEYQDAPVELLYDYFSGEDSAKTMRVVEADPADDSLMDERLQECVFDLLEFDTLSISVLSCRYDKVFSRSLSVNGFAREQIDNGGNIEELYKAYLCDGDIVEVGRIYYLNSQPDLAVTPVFIEGNSVLFKKYSEEFDSQLLQATGTVQTILSPDYISLYEFLSELSMEKISFEVPTFFNVGVPYDQIDTGETGEYYRFLAFRESISDGGLNPFINIVIDGYQTSLYSESDNPYYSNGVALVAKALSNVQDFDSITGFQGIGFRRYLGIVSDEEKVLLNKLGVLTTNTMRNGSIVISNGNNLLKPSGKIMSDIANAYLIRDVIQNIVRQLTVESTNGTIRRTIDELISDRYPDIIRRYTLEIESKVEKKEINRAVRLELYIVGFVKGLQAVIYLG